MRVQCISAQELQRFIYCSCPAHNEQLSKLVHLSQSYYVACMTLLHSLLRFASCFSKCFPFWLTLETDAFSRVFFVHWKRWLIVSYGLFRVPFFAKRKLSSLLQYSCPSISLEIAKIPGLIPREVPITETHHIDGFRIVPVPMDFDTSGVNFLPFIVVHRGSRRDPVGHVVCFGVKYLQVAAALGVHCNNFRIGPRFSDCKD